jgi:hypothetical protein
LQRDLQGNGEFGHQENPETLDSRMTLHSKAIDHLKSFAIDCFQNSGEFNDCGSDVLPTFFTTNDWP